jgi:CheY-like chemotaxis protein
MKILILEDNKERHAHFRKNLAQHELLIVERSLECIAALQTEYWDCVFLDHDLGGEEMVPSGRNTGYEVAQFLADHIYRKPPKVIVHSFNTVGATNMVSLVHGSRWHPGCWLNVDELNAILK